MNRAFLTRSLPRRMILISAGLAAAATMVAGREKPALEALPAPAAQPEQRTAAAPEIDLARLTRAAAPAPGAGPSAPRADPFAPKSFAPAPKPQQAAAREAPSAPPLPFTYIGKLIQDGRTEVFVLRGDELISIAAGQKIDAHYQVDWISDARIAFTYLPLKSRQMLEVPEAGG